MSIIDQTKAKMAAAIEHLKEDLKGIRTSRANPGMLDTVLVEAYGSTVRIKEVASVTAPEPRQLLVTPFDPQLKGPVSKGIEKANLGLMPIVDGNIIRIKIPPMDESIRKEMVKQCHKRKEEAKVEIRNIRRDSNEFVKKQKSQGDIPEDMMKKHEKTIQELTDKYCKEADEVTEKKEKEVTTI